MGLADVPDEEAAVELAQGTTLAASSLPTPLGAGWVALALGALATTAMAAAADALVAPPRRTPSPPLSLRRITP